MPENHSRFVLACQETFAIAAVAAMAFSAAGVVELDIVSPSHPSARGTASSLVSAAPVTPTVRTIALSGDTVRTHVSARSTLPVQSDKDSAPAQEIEIIGTPTPVSGYATVGVTWRESDRVSEDTLAVSVRSRQDGEWSGWEPMTQDADHGPDPASAEAEAARTERGGTDAVVVGDVDEVQVRAVTLAGAAPRGLALAVVDPGAEAAAVDEEPALDTAALSSAGEDDETDGLRLAAATAPKPKIFSRAQWGADERLRDAGSLRYGEVHAAFVHHTVNSNTYTRDQVPSIIRGIYAYHTQSRGWSDIGYNFLVDRFGQVWEGRYGGVDRAVVGAHTLGYNDDAFAMSAIGNFEEVRPSEEMVDAYASLFAWKLGLHDVSADAKRVWVHDRYLDAVNGHRDAGSTACPGRYLYERVGDIAKRAARIQRDGGSSAGGGNGPVTREGNLSGQPWPDLAVRDAASGHLTYVRTGGQSSFGPAAVGAANWGGADLVASPGDVDGDGVGDLLLRSGRTGDTGIHPGLGDGTFGRPTAVVERFDRLDQLTGVGDLDGDGLVDVVGRAAESGRLLLFRGDEELGFRAGRRIADDWSRYDLTAGVGDLDGDGEGDLVARRGVRLYLVPGLGAGRVGQPRQIEGRWGRFDTIAGRGDVTRDGTPDVLARVRDTGEVFVYPGDGAGGFGARLGPWARYAGMRWLALGQRLDGSPGSDLVALDAAGHSRVFSHNGLRNLGTPVDTGVDISGADLVLNVGDWNGDGFGDVMTRSSRTGDLVLRLGRSRSRLAPPQLVRSEWTRVRDVAAVGDVDGDGHPDLQAVRDGEPRYFLGDGRLGISRSVPGGTPLRGLVPGGAEAYDWVIGIVDVDGRKRGDLLVRRAGDGRLLYLPGLKGTLGEPRLVGEGFGRYDLGG